MSFDLTFWSAKEPVTEEAAARIYDELTDGLAGVVDESPAIESFFNDVVAVYPDLVEENMEEAPWASAIYHNAECVITAISWSRHQEVAQVLIDLANRHGLTAYDPQDRVIHHPSAANRIG